eukprot:TRINITY_DN953_c2_g1_i2.p1 TRINITY_DN953_c2_g1~~TRINITY_DN953_c2_g1_i2.p1  ORF type:complete len:271 (-),score=-19.07 TRINITY_DN953_c2_g1_i2:124-936(-)
MCVYYDVQCFIHFMVCGTSVVIYYISNFASKCVNQSFLYVDSSRLAQPISCGFGFDFRLRSFAQFSLYFWQTKMIPSSVNNILYRGFLYKYENSIELVYILYIYLIGSIICIYICQIFIAYWMWQTTYVGVMVGFSQIIQVGKKFFQTIYFAFFFKNFFFRKKQQVYLRSYLYWQWFHLLIQCFFFLFLYTRHFSRMKRYQLSPINLYWNCVDDGGGRQKFQNKVYIYVLMTMVIKYLKIKYIYVYYLLGICWLQYENQFVWAVIQSLVG